MLKWPWLGQHSFVKMITKTKMILMEKHKSSQPNAVVVASILIIILAAIAISLIVTGAITS